MEKISPMLQNRLNALNANNNTDKRQMNAQHEKIYEDLKHHANDVKPNEAKASIIEKETLKDRFIDTKNDIKNWHKAVKYGEISDNALGRTNDVGMKLGSLAIAAFLASHSRTKTQAIMQFVGAGSFFASMSLWPKIFINKPMQLLHKINPGERYVNAQGEKKDSYLDNQFIPTDAQKITDEKEIRRRQKGACQARALNLATVGFAAPTMTALFGNMVEPLIKKQVVNSTFAKSQRALENVDEYLDSAKPISRNTKAIEALCNSYENRQLDKEFFDTLSLMLDPQAFEYKVGKDGKLLKEDGKLVAESKIIFKNPDNSKPIKHLSSKHLSETLERIYENTAEVDSVDLKGKLEQVVTESNSFDDFLSGGFVENEAKTVDIDGIVTDFKALSSRTSADLAGVLKSHGVDELQAQKVVATVKKVQSNGNFFDFIKYYNDEILSTNRGRMKAYIDILNPICGQTAESATTAEYETAMKNFYKGLGFTQKDLEEIKNNDNEFATKKVSEAISRLINGEQPKAQNGIMAKVKGFFKKNETPAEPLSYRDIIQRFAPSSMSEEKASAIVDVMNPDNVEKIKATTGGKDKETIEILNDAIFGSKKEGNGIFSSVHSAANLTRADVQGLKARIHLAFNFEERLKDGSFEQALKDNNLIDEQNTLENWIKSARTYIFQGNVAKDACNNDMGNPKMFNQLKEILFNKEALQANDFVMDEIKNADGDVVAKSFSSFGQEIKNLGRVSEDYNKATTLAATVKTYSTQLFNNKSWMKIFGGLMGGVVLVTLLAQPFFANVKKEFPQNDENRGDK